MIDTGTPDARERLQAVLGVRRLADEVAAAGPYPTVEALAAAADDAMVDLSDDEIATAARTHGAAGPAAGPTPAEPPVGLARADEGAGAALARGYEVYEQRFGHPFVLSAAGRSEQELLDELQRRLKHDPADEAAETKRQLREVVTLRLRDAFGS